MVKRILYVVIGVLMLSSYANAVTGLMAGIAAASAATTAGVTLTTALAAGALTTAAAGYMEHRQASAAKKDQARMEQARMDAQKKAMNKMQIGSKAGSEVLTGRQKTLETGKDDIKRKALRKKRLGTAALRIEPLESKGTTSASGLKTPTNTGLRI